MYSKVISKITTYKHFFEIKLNYYPNDEIVNHKIQIYFSEIYFLQRVSFFNALIGLYNLIPIKIQL